MKYLNRAKVVAVTAALVQHIDNITRSIAICNDTYKFATYTHSILQKFAVESKVMVPSHPEAVRKLHSWYRF